MPAKTNLKGEGIEVKKEEKGIGEILSEVFLDKGKEILMSMPKNCS